MKKTFLALLCILLSCLCICGASAADRASLFIGDSVWQDDALLPFLETDGKQLVPVSAFETLGVKITLSETLGWLLLQKDGAYLSYNLHFGTVLEETGMVSEAGIYRYGGEIYLAPEPICEKFGLTFTTVYASDGYLAARLTNGSETLEFSELLGLYTESGETSLPYLYNPTGKTVAGSFMYPMILRPAAANVPGLVRLLGNHAATFALSPDSLANYTDVLPAIYAAGHTVAYYMDGGDFSHPDTFLEKMEAANELLFALLGKTVRIYVSPEIQTTVPNIEGYHKKTCRMHLVVDDLASDRVVNITLTESPKFNIFNFSLASDRDTRSHYNSFFKKFDTLKHLRSMHVTESSDIQ